MRKGLRQRDGLPRRRAEHDLKDPAPVYQAGSGIPGFRGAVLYPPQAVPARLFEQKGRVFRIKGPKKGNFDIFFAKALDKPGLIFYNCAHLAGIAQLVEHDLAKVGVEGPSPFSRSKKERTTLKWFFLFL